VNEPCPWADAEAFEPWPDSAASPLAEPLPPNCRFGALAEVVLLPVPLPVALALPVLPVVALALRVALPMLPLSEESRLLT